uniref:AMMECR1 domain-containing protein n=1 Tax=Craspedostauros australis TaxID=1486917 RepID=A0A7R9ZRK6_9STRA
MTNDETDATSGPQAIPEMCHHCFDVLIDKLQNSAFTERNSSQAVDDMPAFADHLDDVTVQCPLFITWDKQPHKSALSSSRKRNHGHYELRGCIGNLSPQLLVTAIGAYALTSALRDHRFEPIQLGEVASLRVAVSLLVNYEPCKDAFDWTVGIHGIMIKFHTDSGAFYSATFLPEVAGERRWSVMETLTALIQKAGYNGIIDDQLLASIKCTRYQSSKRRMTFRDYVKQCHQGENPINLTQPRSKSTQQCVHL